MLVEAGLESFSPRAVDLQSIPLYFRHGLTSRAVGTPINPPNRSLTEAGGPQRGAASPSKGEGRALPTATCPARRGLPPRPQNRPGPPHSEGPPGLRGAGVEGRQGANPHTHSVGVRLPPHVPWRTGRHSGGRRVPQAVWSRGTPPPPRLARPCPPQPRHLPRHTAAAASRGRTAWHGAGQPPLAGPSPARSTFRESRLAGAARGWLTTAAGPKSRSGRRAAPPAPKG